MVRRAEPCPTDPEERPTDHDERLGEAIEAYLSLAEQGQAPDPEDFAARYPDLSDDLATALEGLSLVQGLVGEPNGPGHRLESGHRIAGYKIVRELGRGGMGVVYEAVHVGLDRPVALKVLGGHAAPDSNGRRRFLNEARTAAGLHHTHIVPVFDVGQVGGLCYYAMQRIEGCGLDHVVRHLRRDRTTGAGSMSGGSSSRRRLDSLFRSWVARSGSARGVEAPVPPSRPTMLESLGLTGPGDATASWPATIRNGRPPALGGLVPSDGDHDDEPPRFEPPRGSAYHRWVAAVGRQAAEALAYAHHRGIIHRDVKPSNLLVDARGVVWVADFGLARRLADPGLTHHDSLLGTPRYMSPEQSRTGPIDGRTDVYSLGATLYELLTLRPPFEGKTAAELVEQIGGREPAALRQHDPRIPRDLETIVLKALAKRPADRYATATELAEDLGRFHSHEPVKARRIGPLGRLWRVARRHPGITAVSTAAAATVLAVATVAYVRVVSERNIAVGEKNQKERALQRMEAANRATQGAMMNQLWREATVVRMSSVPNRRAKGLGLLKEAEALGPGPALRVTLRDEAIEFLLLRDVEARADFETGRARGIVFGPEGARLAALSDDGEDFHLFDVESRQRLEDQRLRATTATAAETAAGGRGGGRRRGPGGPWVAASGPRVAVVLPDGQGLRLFDAATGAKLRDLKTPGAQVVGVLGAPEGGRFVTVERTSLDSFASAAFQVNLWDAETMERLGKPLATLERWERRPGDPPTLPLAALGPDGKTVATARVLGKEITLWSGRDGTLEGTPVETQAELTALAFGPHGQLAAAGGGAIRLWDVESRTPLPSLNPHQSQTWLMEFSPTGTLLAAAGPGAEVELWDTAAGTLVAVLPTPDRVADLAFTPDGRTLAAAGQFETTAVWAVTEPVVRAQLSGFESPPSTLAFRDDALLALGSWGAPIRFWRPGRCLSGPQRLSRAEGENEVGKPASTAGTFGPGPRDRPVGLAFDDQGRLVALETDALRLWPLPQTSASATRVPLPEMRGRGPSAPLARADDGRTLFLARQSRLLLWHAGEPDRVRPLAPPAGFEARDPDTSRGFFLPGWRSLAASPTGDRLYLVDSEGTTHAWTIEDNQARRETWTLPGNAAHLALRPDGASLALADRERGLLLVDPARGTVVGRLGPADVDSGGAAWSLAFAPLGRELAVGTQQGEVLLWSPADTSRPRLRLPGHRGPVSALVYDPQGRYLATAGPDKIVDVWDVEKVRAELAKLGLAW